jgi:hypothetical protein
MDGNYVVGISFTDDTPKLSNEEITRRFTAADVFGGPVTRPAGRPGVVWGVWVRARPGMTEAEVHTLVARACFALDIAEGADVGWTNPQQVTPDECTPQAKA